MANGAANMRDAILTNNHTTRGGYRSADNRHVAIHADSLAGAKGSGLLHLSSLDQSGVSWRNLGMLVLVVMNGGAGFLSRVDIDGLPNNDNIGLHSTLFNDIVKVSVDIESLGLLRKSDHNGDEGSLAENHVADNFWTFLYL